MADKILKQFLPELHEFSTQRQTQKNALFAEQTKAEENLQQLAFTNTEYKLIEHKILHRAETLVCDVESQSQQVDGLLGEIVNAHNSIDKLINIFDRSESKPYLDNLIAAKKFYDNRVIAENLHKLKANYQREIETIAELDQQLNAESNSLNEKVSYAELLNEMNNDKEKDVKVMNGIKRHVSSLVKRESAKISELELQEKLNLTLESELNAAE